VLTLVSVECHNRPTKSRPGPEAACDDSIERDEEYSIFVVARRFARRVAASLPKIVEKSRLDVALAVAADSPLDQLVTDFYRETIVLPRHDAVDDLQKVAAVNAGVSMTGQRVTVDSQLTIEYLL